MGGGARLLGGETGLDGILFFWTKRKNVSGASRQEGWILLRAQGVGAKARCRFDTKAAEVGWPLPPLGMASDAYSAQAREKKT